MDSINNGPKFDGDAWLELQAFKTRQFNRREKLNRHKDLINGIASQNNNQLASSQNLNSSASQNNEVGASAIFQNQPPSDSRQAEHERELRIGGRINTLERTPRQSDLRSNDFDSPSSSHFHKNVTTSDQCHISKTIECLLLLKLCDVALKLPIDSKSLQRSISKIRGFEKTSQATIENLLEKFAHQELITIELPSTSLRHTNQRLSDQVDDVCIYVISADHTKLVEFDRAFGSTDDIRALLLDSKNDDLIASEETDIVADRQSSVPIQNVRRTYDSNQNEEPACGTHALANSPNSTRLSGGGIFEVRQMHQKIQVRPSKQLQSSDDVESLLSLSSTREKESKKLGEELLELLSKPTAKEKNLLESFRSADGYQVQEFCPKGTKDECRRNQKGTQACDKLHFKKIIAKHTEESLGDCSFLNTCFHMDSCKYVHYEVDYDSKHTRQHQSRKEPVSSPTKALENDASMNQRSSKSFSTSNQNDQTNDISLCSTREVDASWTSAGRKPNTNECQVVSKFALSLEEQARVDIRNRKRYKTVLYPPQWIQCDLRYFDMSLLGKFSVVMADPPWDIHMELPYGTMSDDEMRKLNVPALQDDGVIFLWVTGRAMELGRECLALWGYERCDEIIWVKTNQLQRIIRTGRTGHWLNHGKEHCLVGIKGNPTGINRGLDCDIIVAEVRATSHKPDEIYGIIERLSPGTRKIELFGRAHNVQPNWLTLGNQLDGVRLVESSLIEAFKELNMPYQVGEHATQMS